MSERLAPIPPGEVLLEEFMLPFGVSQNRLARDLGIPVSRVSGIVKGSRSITADTALRLARFFGTSAEMWLRLQIDYDLRIAQRASGPDVRASVRPLTAA